MSAITVCAKGTVNGCATNGRSERPTDSGTICKIIRHSYMNCCGILCGFCNTFSVYFSICFYTYIRKFLRQSRVCLSIFEYKPVL
jgi:hypothetical protein